MRSFEIPTAKGTGYHLFFTTGHQKGMEVIKDAMWAVDPIEGRCIATPPTRISW